jgi:hypothetical protein
MLREINHWEIIIFLYIGPTNSMVNFAGMRLGGGDG